MIDIKGKILTSAIRSDVTPDSDNYILTKNNVYYSSDEDAIYLLDEFIDKLFDNIELVLIIIALSVFPQPNYLEFDIGISFWAIFILRILGMAAVILMNRVAKDGEIIDDGEFEKVEISSNISKKITKK